MIIYMSKIICITNKTLCKEDFIIRIEKIAAQNPKAIILREKDLTEEKYRELAESVITICKRYNTLCILHTFTSVAGELGLNAIHLPLPILKGLSNEERAKYEILGTSCHSVAEAITAQKLGCTYILAGHIFDTDCKKGIPGRGIEFLKDVCKSVSIPVYGLGGITNENYKEVIKAGAKGVAVMSGGMVCQNPKNYLGAFK